VLEEMWLGALFGTVTIGLAACAAGLLTEAFSSQALLWPVVW
jgi:hypothetical protein